jgi:hypothetical protein
VTTFRAPVGTRAGAGSGAPQFMQNRAISGFDRPHVAQTGIGRV